MGKMGLKKEKIDRIITYSRHERERNRNRRSYGKKYEN